MTASPETAGRWFYVHEGRRKGPVDNAQLVELILGGEIPEDTLIWRPGLEEWAPAGLVEEIKRELPPPIPVRDGSPAERDALAEAEALAEGPEGTAAGEESTPSGERRRRRHRSTHGAGGDRRALVPAAPGQRGAAGTDHPGGRGVGRYQRAIT